MAYLLGIDIGTSGTKTLICDAKGKVLATATAEHELLTPKPGWSEQRPADWWAAVVKATRAVVKKAAIKDSDVTGVGLSGQMHGSVFLDKAGKVIRPAILWNDQRTAAECAEIEKLVGGREKLIQLVANPALTGFTAPKILWLRKNERKNFDKTVQILLPKDYIRFCMTGVFATEVSDASGTLLKKLSIDKKLLPKCYESTEITGHITASAAAELGLAEGTPVVGGAADNAAGAVGNGIVSEGLLWATLGTSGVIFAHAEKPTLDPAGRVHTMCHAVPGKWCVFGCMLSAGGSFQWFRNQLGSAEVALAKKLKVDPYELLIKEAAAAPAVAEGLFFLPYLTGERCPYPDPLARGAWIGLTARTNRGMMIRALVEGVTFGMRDMLEIMRSMHIPVGTMRASGGGARSEFWKQLQANIYNTPIAVTNASEGPAYGVALLAGVGTGVWKSVDEACKKTISQTQKVPVDPKAAGTYEKAYQVYNKLYGDLKDRFAAMGKL